MSKTPTTLIIMDGFGLSSEEKGNAIRSARTPFLDKVFSTCPGCQLSASGLDVGLPEGQMGNSEVGHTNIGAGRVVFQDLPRITKAVQDGTFFENEAYCEAMDDCKERGTALHLMGLLSDGGVHSHITHVFALLEMAKRRGVSKVYVHCFLDGRDVPPSSGKGYVAQLVEKCKEIGIGQIATVMGRFYAMDRDKRWERLQRAYDAIANGEAPFEADPVAAVQKSYDAGVTDEFMEPVGCTEKATVKAGDPAASWTPPSPTWCARRATILSPMCAPPSTTPPCPTCRWPSPTRSCTTSLVSISASWVSRSCASPRPRSMPM